MSPDWAVAPGAGPGIRIPQAQLGLRTGCPGRLRGDGQVNALYGLPAAPPDVPMAPAFWAMTLTTSLLGICPQVPPSGTRRVDKQPELKTKTRLVESTVFSDVFFILVGLSYN